MLTHPAAASGTPSTSSRRAIPDAVGLATTILSSPLVSAAYLSKNLIIIFMALGVSIGACGSIISMRRFLDA